MDYSFIKSPEDLLKVQTKDIGSKLFKYLFGRRKEGVRFKTDTQFVLKKGQYPYLEKDIKTTMGNYMVNRALFNDNLIKELGYINKRFSADTVENIEAQLSDALLEDRISVKDLIYYMDRIQFFGFSLSSTFVPSITEKTVFLDKSIKKEKEKLIKEAGDKINDPIVAAGIQKKLIDKAKESIGNDVGMDLYESGSKASFGNNFAKLFLMNGPMIDINTGEYRTSTSSYSDGVKKSEADLYANSMTEAAFAKGVNTQMGGYLVKKYMAAFQSVMLDKKGSDCGTTKTLDIFLTKEISKLFLHRYIKTSSGKVRLSKTNIDKYIGTNIKVFSPMYCIGNKICNKCAGEYFYKLGGMENIGLTTSKVCSSIMNKSLKKFHDKSIKVFSVSDANQWYD